MIPKLCNSTIFISLVKNTFCRKYIFPCINMEFLSGRTVEKKKVLGKLFQLWEKFIQKRKNAHIPITICRKCCFCRKYLGLFVYPGQSTGVCFFCCCCFFCFLLHRGLPLSPISHVGIFIPWALFSLHLYFQCPYFASSPFFLNNPIRLYFLMFCFQKHLENLLKSTPTSKLFVKGKKHY